VSIKINEIKLTSGKDVLILQPTTALVIVAGKPQNLDAKLAASIWKAICPPAEKFFSEAKTWKPEA
jgi:hypothetical protein